MLVEGPASTPWKAGLIWQTPLKPVGGSQYLYHSSATEQEEVVKRHNQLLKELGCYTAYKQLRCNDPQAS